MGLSGFGSFILACLYRTHTHTQTINFFIYNGGQIELPQVIYNLVRNVSSQYLRANRFHCLLGAEFVPFQVKLRLPQAPAPPLVLPLPPPPDLTVFYESGLCRWIGCETRCANLPAFLRHVSAEHANGVQVRVQAQIVAHLEEQVVQERERLNAMTEHLGKQQLLLVF